MKIHEYQAKALLSEFGIPIPEGRVAHRPKEARSIARRYGGKVAIKAQVYAGARGKAGGIKIAESPDEAEQITSQLLGTRLVTNQTTSEGLPIHEVLVEKVVSVERELYLSIVVDTASRMPVMIGCEAGGMDIEEVARVDPEKIIKAFLDPVTGFQDHLGNKLAYGMNIDQAQVRTAIGIMANIYRLFINKDCSLIEINPLVITDEGQMLALDAKITFDDNAIFRHSDIEELQDLEQEDPLEVRAKELGVSNYIKMDGNIGCMVNGAGLAMAAMDLINQEGGKPANFLDIGTVNNPERVVSALRIITADPALKAILVNIFGGITRADIIAQGLVEAHRQIDIRVPLIVRLAGTNAEEGKQILRESKINYIEAFDFRDAAKKAVRATAGEKN